MPTDIQHDPNETPKIPYTAEQQDAVADWFDKELQSAKSARTRQEAAWRAVDALYDPEPRTLDFPLSNSTEFPVPIGAIACDALYAQALDLIFSLDPPVVIRPARSADPAAQKQRTEDAKALQTWLDWKVRNELNFRDVAEHGILSTCKKGTAVYYIPYTERIKKTRVGLRQQLPQTPIFAIPIDDFFLPGGRNMDIKTAPWVAVRLWKSRAQMAELIKLRGWPIDPEALTSSNVDSNKQAAEQASKTSDVKLNDQDIQDFELIVANVRYDIDNDGVAEDLLLYYDAGSSTLLHLADDPYDHRPFSRSRYQIREHMFYGLGVVDMLKTFQEEATDTHTQRSINMHLVNTRMYVGPDGGVEGGTLRVWPGRYLNEAIPNSIRELKLTDVYPSSAQNEAAALSLAERRVGANELAVPAPSQLLGSRTPTGTATIGMAQVNRRFAPAFDEMRTGLSNAVKQSLYRDQEQLLAGNFAMEQKIRKAVGETFGDTVIALLRDEQFDEAYGVELQATTANMSREVERQNTLFLMQLLAGYYDRLLQMSQLAASPGAPPEMVATVRKVMESATELIDRVLRSFDQMRDPDTFLVKLDDELTSLQGQSEANQVTSMNGINQLLAGALGGVDQGGGGALPFGNGG